MTTLKEDAKVYEPKRIKNIADLESVSVETEIKEEVRKNTNGEEYTIDYLTLLGEEYRVPNSVRAQLQAILNEKPDIKTFKVIKKGEGKNTTYTVIQLE